MFSQTNVTPKEKKVPKSIGDKEGDDAARQETASLVLEPLQPFQPPTRINLESTVYNPVKCCLSVKNPSSRNLNVSVIKTPPRERSIELSALELLVEAAGSVELDITWTPQEIGSWRDTLQLLDSRRMKHEVALITTATGAKKASGQKRSRVLRDLNVNRSNATSLNLLNVPSKRPRLKVRPEGKENSPRAAWTYESPGGSGAKGSSVKNEPKEVSRKLHEPDDLVRRLCNPDPFGATMTGDPFLTNTLHYDEECMNRHGTDFKKWLNALLTPPEHLSGDVDTIRVDVCKVWQLCRTREDVALAETREAVSARYHTNTRLDTLRKAACAMFRREEVISALSKATVCIERGALMIRQDRDLHHDTGLQKNILELFLSYNPLWLRIGLETVYGETIPLHSNNDLVGLTRFLITRFFADPLIVKTQSLPKSPNVKTPSFGLHMNKFILRKFILFVFFLDYAKRNKLIGHDPCLFHKRAPHKESREILLNFSREVLGGVGDVTKVLRAHGYVVSHKQTYLDEYDYAVNDIAVDLRDGVRLCRVMELITGDRNLTGRCEQVAALPNSKPDWGFRLKRPRLFTTVHHAMSSLIKRLKTETAT